MTLGITCAGFNRYGVTFDDRSVLMSVGEVHEGIELYEFMDIIGISVQTFEGIFNTDIKGSGVYKLTKVEDEKGNMYSV